MGGNEPGALDPLQSLLFSAASAGDREMLVVHCQQHTDEILATFGTWTRLPLWARTDERIARGWATALMAIAETMDMLGYPEPLERVAGRSRDNPAVKWQDMVTHAQRLAASGRGDESDALLAAVLDEIKGASGPLVTDLRTKSYGALGANAFARGAYAECRRYTSLALEACRVSGDRSGARVYTESLDVIDAVTEWSHGGGSSSDLLNCRERIADAQTLSDATRYVASKEILCQLEAEFAEGRSGAGMRYRAKVLGLLGLNYFRLGDHDRAREYTERARVECQRVGDDDGIRIYSANLQAIARPAS